jgi:3-oxoacyl-[acyl-carrier protein] reductase
MLIDLRSKVAIVTGAGRGIGLEIARTLAAEGVATTVADVRQDLLDHAAAQWRDKGWTGAHLRCDVTSAADCRALAASVEQQFGRIDILVNNAGVGGGGRIETLEEEVWDRNADINLKSMFLMSQAVIPAMKRQGSGRILNASSFAAVIPSIGGGAYAASKAGVHALTRVLAGELGPFGITANCYAPGMIPTEMNRFADATEERAEQLLDTLSLRRWGEAADVAKLICFLASDQAAYITGAMIEVSGGKFATQMPWMAHRQGN